MRGTRSGLWCVVLVAAVGYAASSGPPALTFGAPVPLPEGGSPTNVVVSGAIADVTGDGKPDVVLGPAGSLLTIHPGNGDGTFGVAIKLPVGAGLSMLRLRAAQLRPGAAADVVLYHQDTETRRGEIDVLSSDGVGGFTTSSYRAPDSTFDDVEIPALADWDGDGAVDVVTVSILGTLRVRLNDGAGRFPRCETILLPDGPFIYPPNDLAVGDFDGDGRADVAVRPSGVYWRESDGSLSAGPKIVPRAGLGLVAADVDGDGLADLVAANGSYADGTNHFGDSVSVFRHTGRRSFGSEERYPSKAANESGGLWDIAVADLNGDARPEIVAQEHVLVNLGDGRFGPPLPLPGDWSGGALGVAVGDLDGDGRPDIVPVDYWDFAGGAFISVGTGTTAPFVSSFAPASLAPGASADVALRGSGFQSGATVDFGAGIDAGGVVFDSASSIRAAVTVASEAAVGPRTVSVRNPDGTSASAVFTVSPGAPVVIDMLDVASVSPDRAHAGDTLDVTLLGAAFLGSVTVAAGQGAAVNSVTVIDETRVRARLTLADDAPQGPLSLTITTSVNSLTVARQFTVLAPRSLDVVPLHGRLRPSSKRTRGSFVASGSLVFNSKSPDGKFDPATETAEVRFGDPANPMVTPIAAGAGWRVRRQQATWTSPRGATPRVRLVLDFARRLFKLVADRAQVVAPPAGNVMVEFTLGGETGTAIQAWRPVRDGTLAPR